MSTFAWRAADRNDDASSVGCLFACSSSNPSMKLVPPVNSTNASNHETTTANTIMNPRPTPGDDLSPPNAVKARNINGISVPFSTSAGWSNSPPWTQGVYPSAIAYDLRLRTNTAAGSTSGDSLELAVTLEYNNNRYNKNESMMVKVSVAKTLVHAEMETELALVTTRFQEYIPTNNEWVDITADVDYTKTADSVVDAVLNDPTAGQTAGKATATAEAIDLTLGPFSAKARLILIFQVENLYTYQAMSLSPDASDIGSRRLLPLWVSLPFAPFHHEAGLTAVTVRLEAPSGTTVNPCQEAYSHLKEQSSIRETTIVAVKELVANDDHPGAGVVFQRRWESLPPRSCGVLAWLSLPNPTEDDTDFDYVHIGRSMEQLNVQQIHPSEQGHAVLKVPSEADLASLRVPLPGHGPMGSLWRLKVKIPKAQPRQDPYFIMNLTLSDKSASTGRQIGSTTMRQRFNELSELRFLKRLESIPSLVQAGVLRLDDIWMDVFLAFDHAAPKHSIHRVCFRIRDVVDSIGAIVQTIRLRGDVTASHGLPDIGQHVRVLRGIAPGGATDFAVGPEAIVEQYINWEKEAAAMVRGKAIPCTFVEFDTDGGHNGSNFYLESLQRLRKTCHVKNGVVTGFGSWLNQDCASKVARIFGSVPAQLALQVPEPGTEGLNHIFRRAFSAWVEALRQPPPLAVTVSAGSVSFPSPSSSRHRTANAVEVLAMRCLGDGNDSQPDFGPPDVLDEAFTKCVIKDAPAGEELILYIASRLEDVTQLTRALDVRTNSGGHTEPVKAVVSTVAETSAGNFIAYDWLNMLTSKDSYGKGFKLSSIMATSLSSRLEDEVSFRFNVASPSGKTSYLGRSKTVANRASIDSKHQPAPPANPIKLPLESEPSEAQFCYGPLFGGPPPSSGLFGGPPPSGPFGGPPPPACAAPPPSSFDGFMSSASDRSLAQKYGGGFGTSSVASFQQQQSLAQHYGASFHRTIPSWSAASSQQQQSLTQQYGASASASFGSSAAFGSSARCYSGGRAGGRAGGRGAISRSSGRTIPLWSDVMLIPVGSNSSLSEEQNYDALKRSMGEIIHARQRLRMDPNIPYFCDICNHNFEMITRTTTSGVLLEDNRYHCLDCQDFDACINCQHHHRNSFPLHRIINISSATASSTCTAVGKDPLIDTLLGVGGGYSSSQSNVAANTTSATSGYDDDRTQIWCMNKVQRFLCSILDWWPMFRATCVFRDRLPVTMPLDMIERITKCCGRVNDDIKNNINDNNNTHINVADDANSNIRDLLETITIVIDSLMREEDSRKKLSPN